MGKATAPSGSFFFLCYNKNTGMSKPNAGVAILVPLISRKRPLRWFFACIRFKNENIDCDTLYLKDI